MIWMARRIMKAPNYGAEDGDPISLPGGGYNPFSNGFSHAATPLLQPTLAVEIGD
jgi:hypothetical protein